MEGSGRVEGRREGGEGGGAQGIWPSPLAADTYMAVLTLLYELAIQATYLHSCARMPAAGHLALALGGRHLSRVERPVGERLHQVHLRDQRHDKEDLYLSRASAQSGNAFISCICDQGYGKTIACIRCT